MMTDNTTNLDIQADRLYDQTDLAARLDLPISWCERARWAGSGPRFIKVGRFVRYRGADILAWLESQTRQSTSDGAGHERK